MSENLKETPNTSAEVELKPQFTVVGTGEPKLSELFTRLLGFTSTSTLDFDPGKDSSATLASAAEAALLTLDSSILSETSPNNRAKALFMPVEQLSFVLAQIAQLGLLTEAMKRTEQASEDSEMDLLAIYSDKVLEVYDETGLNKPEHDSLDGMSWLLDAGVGVLLQAYKEVAKPGEVDAYSEAKTAGKSNGFPLGIGTLHGGAGAKMRYGSELGRGESCDGVCQK